MSGQQDVLDCGAKGHVLLVHWHLRMVLGNLQHSRQQGRRIECTHSLRLHFHLERIRLVAPLFLREERAEPSPPLLGNAEEPPGPQQTMIGRGEPGGDDGGKLVG